MNEVTSPCTKVCTVDETGQLCVGCFRTVEEIGQWTTLTEAERREIVDKLPGRRRAFAQGAPGPNRAQ